MLAQVDRIMAGQKSGAFGLSSSAVSLLSDRSLSLIYQNGRSLDLIFADVEEFRAWFEALSGLILSEKASHASESQQTRFLREQWRLADVNGDGQLSAAECQQLITQMNLNHDPAYIEKAMSRVDEDASGTVSFAEFQELMKILNERPEFVGLFTKLCGSEPLSDVIDGALPVDGSLDAASSATCPMDRFEEFLRVSQGEVVDDGALAVLDECGHLRGENIDYDTFVNFLSRTDNGAFAPRAKEVYQDMSHPLSHYWIASSHNTYLEGDQLRSASSVHRYIEDLSSGCRCVELDCWDGDNGRPVIYHGHTLTSKIAFRDVVEAVAEWAFKSNRMPVILSLENHCSIPQQRIMASDLKSILGERLCRLPEGAADLPLLAPEELYNKVIIKGKVPLQAAAAEENDEDTVDVARFSEEERKLLAEREGGAKAEKEHKVKTAPELAEITFLAGKKFKGFDAAAANDAANYMSSFSEGKTEKLIAKSAREWSLYNQRQMSRIYPAGLRVDSSNYPPSPSWCVGSQIVALNYQTPGPEMHINRGLFCDNGGLGYVLKPPCLLADAGFHLEDDVPETPRQTLRVQVLSAQQLPKPDGSLKGEIIDPYVCVEVHGVPADRFSARTRTVYNNGFNPVFGDAFDIGLRCPELAVIYFAVHEADVSNADDFIAYSAMRVANLRPGVRRVNLLSKEGSEHGQYAFASLSIWVY